MLWAFFPYTSYLVITWDCRPERNIRLHGFRPKIYWTRFFENGYLRRAPQVRHVTTILELRARIRTRAFFPGIKGSPQALQMYRFFSRGILTLVLIEIFQASSV